MNIAIKEGDSKIEVVKLVNNKFYPCDFIIKFLVNSDKYLVSARIRYHFNIIEFLKIFHSNLEYLLYNLILFMAEVR